jgi:RNA polymerase sigma-70 factor (ECF subfamily)
VSGTLHLEAPGLIQSYLRGDPSAVEQVDDWIETVLRRWAPTPRSDWDDLRQEVHTRVVKNLSHGHFDGRSSLRTYVHRIAQNVCIDRLRQTQRLRHPHGNNPETTEAAGPEAESIYMAREMLLRILDGLTSKELELLKRVHVERDSYADLARQLGISEGAVKLRVFRLREQLLRKYRALSTPGARRE